MTLAEIAAFALVASVLVRSPGPNGVLIARTVPTAGRRAGWINIAGFATAFYVHGALSIFGLSVILLNSAWAFTAVKWIGAAYLAWIGIKALREAFDERRVARGTDAKVATPGAVAPKRYGPVRAFSEGFLTNALNPKVSMFYLAAFPQFIAAHAATTGGAESALGQTLSAFTLVTVHAAINIAWFGAMVLFFGQLTSMARSGSFRIWLKGVTGVVFLGFAGRLATFRP